MQFGGPKHSIRAGLASNLAGGVAMKPNSLAMGMLAIALIVPVLSSAGVADDPPPQTQPARNDAPASLLTRVRQAASSVKLSDEQKRKLDTMFQQAGNDLKSTAEKFKED